MISRLIVILMVVGLSACGDDAGSGSEAPEPQSQNNETNTNNVSVSQGSTNSESSNNTNSNATNNSTANLTNNTTAKTSTNNDTAGTHPDPAGTLSCMDILGCLLSCHADDEACEQECRELGDDQARAQIDDYLTCVDTLCAEAMTVTALTECTLDKCSEEQDTCLNPEGE